MEPFIRSKYIQKLKLVREKTPNPMPVTVCRTSADMYQLFKEIHAIEGDDVIEYMYVIFLNRAKKAIGYSILSKGGMVGTVVDCRILLTQALQLGSIYVALCHNHPSNEIKPSSMDESLTREVKKACSAVNIMLIDHLVLGEEIYYSFADEGLL